MANLSLSSTSFMSLSPPPAAPLSCINEFCLPQTIPPLFVLSPTALINQVHGNLSMAADACKVERGLESCSGDG